MGAGGKNDAGDLGQQACVKEYPEREAKSLRAPQVEQPSLMARKFLAHAAAIEQDPSLEEKERERNHLYGEWLQQKRDGKELYFFYGSLMDPAVLRKVLVSRDIAQLRPARIVGYQVKMWGTYPALLDGEPGQIVRGMVCEIEGGQNKDRLAAYETSNYDVRKVLVYIDGEEGDFYGNAFEWIGDEEDLKEGVFDLKDWQMRRAEHE